MITQEQITEFYDNNLFPSRTSHKAYDDLVPKDLRGFNIGDFGCGQSLFINVFKKLQYNAIFLDISHNALRSIDSSRKIRASLTSIPLHSGCMDIIFCIGVIHHIPDIESSISELLRVLKKDGTLYLGVYASRSFQAILRALYDSTKINIFKKLVYSLAWILIWLKNCKNGLILNSIEHNIRTDDLLKTPLVRYFPASYYFKKIGVDRCKVAEIKRISCMNIIIVKKL